MLKAKTNYSFLAKIYFANKTRYNYLYKKFQDKVIIKKTPAQKLSILSFRKKKFKNKI